MKQLFTSNYAREGKNPLAISISCIRPRWWPNIKWMPELGPTWEMVKQYKIDHDIENYTAKFWDVLFERGLTDPYVIVEQIPENSILLCWEKPSDFCHRHLIAKWFVDSNTAKVVELVKKNEIPYLMKTNV